MPRHPWLHTQAASPARHLAVHRWTKSHPNMATKDNKSSRNNTRSHKSTGTRNTSSSSSSSSPGSKRSNTSHEADGRTTGNDKDREMKDR